MRKEFLENMEKYMVYVYNISLKMLGEDDAEDAAQEALIKAYEKIDDFRGDSAFSTWLYRITINVCKDILRTRKPTIPLEEVVELEGGTDPELEAEREEVRHLVRLAMLEISPEFREILILRELLGYDYEEIAKELAIPAGTVKSRINRARTSLKNRILLLQKGEDPSEPGKV